MCNFYLINKQNLFATGGQLGTGTIQLMMISGLFLVVMPFKDELNFSPLMTLAVHLDT